MKKETFKILTLFILLALCNACQAQKNAISRSNEDIKKIVLSFFESATRKEQNIDNEILISSNSTKVVDNWVDLLNMSHLPMIRNIDIKTKEDIIDFSVFFSEKDIKYILKRQGREIKYKFWSELFDYPINKKGKNNLWVSYPVFDLKREHAIVYIESIDGGSLVVFKKEHDSWKSFASGLIWIE